MTTENPGGFTEDVCIIQGVEEYSGYFVKITAQNEIFIADKVDSDGNFKEMLACSPDIISIVNLEASMSWHDIYIMTCTHIPHCEFI